MRSRFLRWLGGVLPYRAHRKLAAKLLDGSCNVDAARLTHMRVFKLGAIFTSIAAVLLLLAGTSLGPEPYARTPISADDFARAVTMHCESLIELYLTEHLDPNARVAQGCTLLLIAALQQDRETVHRLLDAGARVNIADKTGFTPLMAAAMHGDLEMFDAFLARSVHADMGARCRDGRDLLGVALDSGSKKIIETILGRLPPMQQWTTSTRRVLDGALRAGNKDRIRLLLHKHAAPPTPEGKTVPLLAYSIASNDAPLFTTLLACGADPNTALPAKYDQDFLALLPSKAFRSYIEDDRGVTVLMLAAGLGQTEYLRALIEAGADRNRVTSRSKMVALDLAAETQNWRCTQILLGSGPPPDQLRVEISLASQHAEVIKDGVPVFRTVCSTGRDGYATRTGSYVITNKERNHRSTIYKVEMPYFMRLSCLDFGMHEGVVPNYPASHGCIRLPGDAARKFFAEIPVGTLVTVK
jgi:ankyrin repeat protein